MNRHWNKVLIPAAALLFCAATVTPRLHAQEQTTTTSETTTTTTNGVPAPPPAAGVEVELAPPMPGYATFGYAPDNYAAHRGYNDGYNKGISDHNTGHSYRPTSDHYYDHPIGYKDGMGVSHHEYDRVYREAFLHGYERGYRGANGQ